MEPVTPVLRSSIWLTSIRSRSIVRHTRGEGSGMKGILVSSRGIQGMTISRAPQRNDASTWPRPWRTYY